MNTYGGGLSPGPALWGRPGTKRARITSILILLLLSLLASSGLSWAQDVPGTGNIPSQHERKTILILGDSLAAGFGLDPTEAFPALLQKKVDQAGLPFTVINAGLSGDTTAGGMRRIEWQLKRKVDLLVLELGANDGLRGLSVENTKSNLQAIINRTREKNPHVQLVIAGMQMPPNMGATYNLSFQKVFPELARDNQAGLVPFLLAGVGGQSQLNQADLIHPNAAGHQIVAENVWKVLAPLLKPRPANGS